MTERREHKQEKGMHFLILKHIMSFLKFYIIRRFDSFKSKVDHGCFKIDLFALGLCVSLCHTSFVIEFKAELSGLN